MREAHEAALLAWVEDSLALVSWAGTVIYAFQAAPSPEEPFATLQILTEVEECKPAVTNTTTAATGTNRFVQTVAVPITGTFTVSIFGASHRRWARALELLLRDQSIQDSFDVSGVRVRRSLGGNSSRTPLRSVAFEDHSVVDFEFTFSATENTAYAAMQKATVASNIVETFEVIPDYPT